VRTVFFKFSIHDWTGGYRALKKEVFLKENNKLTNFKGYIFQISFLHIAVRDGFKIAEVPFHFSDRTLGDSKIAPFGYIMDVVKYVLWARMVELKRFIKFLIVGGSGFVIQVITQEGAIAIGIASSIALALQPSVHSLISTDIKNLTDSVGAGIGAEFSILSNYLWNNFWTFEDTRNVKHNSGFFGRLLKFNFFSMASILIQFLAVFIAEKVLGIYVVIAGYTIPVRILILFPAIIFFVIPLNYIIYNKIIWKTQYLNNEKNPHK
jgi:dolichol-phosphate mannosyltransferase